MPFLSIKRVIDEACFESHLRLQLAASVWLGARRANGLLRSETCSDPASGGSSGGLTSGRRRKRKSGPEIEDEMTSEKRALTLFADNHVCHEGESVTKEREGERERE